MQVEATEIPGVVVITPEVHRDARGLFVEPWQGGRYAALGIGPTFVQDGLSLSQRNVLRGLHYQVSRPQGHLITVLRGSVFDVAVDLRSGSPSFGRWTGNVLHGERFSQIWLPAGVAHGFCVISEEALIHYKMTALYHPGDEGGVLWSDPQLAIRWPVEAPLISDKDRAHPHLLEIPAQRLPHVSFL